MVAIWADVYNASGDLVGEGPIASLTGAEITRVLDGPGEIRITAPSSDPRVIDLIDNERTLALYTYEGDAKRALGRGVVRKLQGTGSTLTLALSGPDELDQLRQKNTLLARSYDGDTVAEVVDDLVGLVSGWTVDTDTIPENTVFARFDGASVLKGLQEIAKQQGLHFRLDGDEDIRFGPLGDDAPIRLVQAGSAIQSTLADNDDVALIKELTWLDDSEAVANWIIPLGKGQGEAALTLEQSTRSADRIETAEGWTTGQDSYYPLKQSGGLDGDRLAQSFQLSEDTWVNYVKLYLRATGSPTGTLTLYIQTDSGGAPSESAVHANAVCTAITEPSIDTDDGEWVTFSFPGGFYLDASTTYWIVLSTTRAADASNYIMWGADADEGYTDGTLAAYYSSAWHSVSYDGLFQIQTTIKSMRDATMAEHGPANRDGVEALRYGFPSVEISYSGATFSADDDDGTHTAANAFDGSNTTYWKKDGTGGAPTTGWIAVELTKKTRITRYGIYAKDESGPSSWQFQGSNNGTDWDTLDTQYAQSFSVGMLRAYSLSSPAFYTYYRLNVTAGHSYTALLVYELNLYISKTSFTKLTQSFQASAATALSAYGGRVKEVVLWLAKHGSPGGDLTVQIQTDSSGYPSGSAVTNGSGTSDAVAASTLSTTPAAVTFTFEHAPKITSSTTYWIVLQTTDSDSQDDFVTWAIDSESGYSDGQMRNYNGSTWVTPGVDAIFRVEAEGAEETYAISTTTGPDGSTLYYLADDDSITAYGQIERVFTAEITPLSHSETDMENAANALYDAAVAWLERYAVKQRSYSCTVVKARDTLKPGMLVPLAYKGFVVGTDGAIASWLDVSDLFWIVKAQENAVTGEVQLELSNIDRAKEDVASLIVGTMEKVSLDNVAVKPYPAVFCYTYTDFIQEDKSVGGLSGTFTFGKRARFVLPIGNTIHKLLKVVMRVQTKPLYVLDVYDTVNAAPDLLDDYGVIEDDDYPANISLYLNGEDVSADFGGPWMTDDDQNEAWSETIDLTQAIIDAGVYGEHTIEFEAGDRAQSAPPATIYTNIPGYINSSRSNDSHGVVIVTFEVHCTTQAIKVG